MLGTTPGVLDWDQVYEDHPDLLAWGLGTEFRELSKVPVPRPHDYLMPRAGYTVLHGGCRIPGIRQF